jgi:hypothetical protein
MISRNAQESERQQSGILWRAPDFFSSLLAPPLNRQAGVEHELTRREADRPPAVEDGLDDAGRQERQPQRARAA